MAEYLELITRRSGNQSPPVFPKDLGKDIAREDVEEGDVEEDSITVTLLCGTFLLDFFATIGSTPTTVFFSPEDRQCITVTLLCGTFLLLHFATVAVSAFLRG